MSTINTLDLLVYGHKKSQSIGLIWITNKYDEYLEENSIAKQIVYCKLFYLNDSITQL